MTIKKLTIILGFLLPIFVIIILLQINQVHPLSFISPAIDIPISPTIKPLEKYSLESLKQREFAGSNITIDKVMKDDDEFTSSLFFFTSDGKIVSGLINVPKKEGEFPVILMIRGFVPREIFTTGEGTRRSSETFARNGFITLAPDFLGYGESASPSALPIEERFETYTTALNLLSSIPNLNQALETIDEGRVQADTGKIGLWGHSNGGHIALTVLEITGISYPTVLWAPVSKPFPYSILYYTDEFEDHGKALRKVVADFEKDYDSEKYSLTNYLDWIMAPIELHQGTADEAVPTKWSDELYNNLKKLKKEITYFTYQGDDHNFSQGSWSKVVERNLQFYKRNL